MAEQTAEESSLFADIESEITGNEKESAPSEVEVQETETQVETEVTTETETEVEVETKEKPKSDGFQKRIDKRTKDYYVEKNRADKLEAENVRLKYQSKSVKPEPTLEQFDYDETVYQKELAKHYAQQAVSEIKQETAVSKAQEESGKIASDFAGRIKKSGIENYGEKMNNLVDSFGEYDPDNNILAPIIDVVMLADDGPEMAAYLSEHTDEAHRIANLNPSMVPVEMGKLSAKLSAVKPKKTTTAPKPVKTAGSGGTASTKDIGDKDADHSLAELDKILYD